MLGGDVATDRAALAGLTRVGRRQRNDQNATCDLSDQQPGTLESSAGPAVSSSEGRTRSSDEDNATDQDQGGGEAGQHPGPYEQTRAIGREQALEPVTQSGQ